MWILTAAVGWPTNPVIYAHNQHENQIRFREEVKLYLRSYTQINIRSHEKNLTLHCVQFHVVMFMYGIQYIYNMYNFYEWRYVRLRQKHIFVQYYNTIWWISSPSTIDFGPLFVEYVPPLSGGWYVGIQRMRKGWIKCKRVVVRIIWDTNEVWQFSFTKYFWYWGQ